jgi:hypothetical protein
MKKLLLLFALLFLASTINPVVASALVVSNNMDGYSISTDLTVNTDTTGINVDNTENTDFNIDLITISPPDPSTYARLFIDESEFAYIEYDSGDGISLGQGKVAYVRYGGNATIKWESNKMSSCNIHPIDQSGTSGEYLLQNITSNTNINISCITNLGRRYLSIKNTSQTIKVLPPTFDNLKQYLSSLQSDISKKVNLTSTSVLLEQAQKAYDSGNTEKAQAFLQKSVENLQQHLSRGNFAADKVHRYEDMANHLTKVLPVKLLIAPDGCSVTAIGPDNLTLKYGSHEDGLAGFVYAAIGIGPQYPIIYGWTAGSTILNNEITRSIPARSGWTTFGKISDSDGLVYALDELEVTNDCKSVSNTTTLNLNPQY